GVYIMLIGYITTLLGGVARLGKNVRVIIILDLIISIAVILLAIRNLGVIEQFKQRGHGVECFTCEQMPKELNSAKLFLEWYKKVSNSTLELGNATCVKICSVPESSYYWVTFSLNNRNFTIRGEEYVDSIDKIPESEIWFEEKNYCFKSEECTGIKLEYESNYSSSMKKGVRGICVNKYLASYKPKEVFSVIGNWGIWGVKNWTITDTVELITSQKPLTIGIYNCTCAKSLISERYYCQIGMRVG
ncbi:MAG: hypothetical protein DRP00_03245, partial [Candidatus Aenigmatarchaeota archaeon]